MRLLHEFFNMYGSRCTIGLREYQQGRAPVAVLGKVPDAGGIRPDMTILTMSEPQLLEHARLQGGTEPRPGIQGTLAQFRTFHPSSEAIIGLLYPDGEVLTFVVTVQAAATSHR